MGKFMLKCKKASPTLLIIFGIGGLIGAGIMACKQSTKLKEVKENHDAELAAIDNAADRGVIAQDDVVKEKIKAKARLVATYIKMYAPAVALGSLSVLSIVKSHKIMTKRNEVLSTTLLSATEGFNAYRQAVKEKYGEAVDKELGYGAKPLSLEDLKPDENGKKPKLPKAMTINPNKTPSPYAICFAEGCNGWTKDPQTNMMILQAAQRNFNYILESRMDPSKGQNGYVFLNEIREYFHLPPTGEGQFMGWIKACKEEDQIGNDFIDFGLYEAVNDLEKANFVNGLTPYIWMDFNVVNIIDHI